MSFPFREALQKKTSERESLLELTEGFFALQKKTSEPESLLELTEGFFALQKKKTSVISRGFNHQSKNEQLIRLLFAVKFQIFKFQIPTACNLEF